MWFSSPGLRETSQNNYEWTDGSEYSYSNWVDQDFDGSDSLACVRLKGLNNFMWDDDPNCEVEIPILCEYSKSKLLRSISGRYPSGLGI